MYFLSSFFNLVDIVCLRNYWILEITRLDLAREIIFGQSRDGIREK